MKYLLDTNVVSDSRRNVESVQRWLDTPDRDDVAVSAITIAELKIGVLRKERTDSLQGALLRLWLEETVLRSFENRILPVDTSVALCFAGMQVPNPAPVLDSLIAATAIVHDLTLVTRNTKNMERSGVRLLNPWLLDEETVP